MPSNTKKSLPRPKIAARANDVTSMWPGLARSTRDAFEAVQDVKLEANKALRRPLHVSASEGPRSVREKLQETLGPAAFKRIDINVLSGEPEQVTALGLVYLPGRYVVPGGRFNEIYGWNSYFIAMGLLAEGRISLAQSIADQHLYQVRHSGTVLNDNRAHGRTNASVRIRANHLKTSRP